MRGAGPYARELPLAVQTRIVPRVVAVEALAPAAAEDPVVRLDEACERIPRRLVECPDAEVRHDAASRSHSTSRRSSSSGTGGGSVSGNGNGHSGFGSSA